MKTCSECKKDYPVLWKAKTRDRGDLCKDCCKGINVLSLFNGMSTGHTALDNVGIKVNKYYSSELKPYAIELTQYHYPETIQLGDVNNWSE